MCWKSCNGFTGALANLDNCPDCGESRWDPIRLAESGGETKIARRQFYTIPLGPQLQALWRSKEGATAMRYRTKKTQEILAELAENGGKLQHYDDLLSGIDYIEAVRSGIIKEKDMLLIFSVDGAQLYAMKESDCWIYIWIIVDLNPDIRYKKKYVYPGGIIPGKPKNAETFFFPGLHHVAALMCEGLMIWDAVDEKVYRSDLFSLL
ncbi:hypothetical protein C8J57DRAFT_953976, partial [Mycena rebaudengoi]